MKEKRLLIVLLAALLVFSLFGCGKKEDAPAANLDIPASDEDTVDSGIASTETTVGKTVLTGRELEDLFIFGYDTEKFSRENLYQDQYAFYCDKYPKRSIGTQADAIAYGWVENEMSNSKYKDKELPDDGFEQYVAWREAQSASTSTPSTSTPSGSNSSQSNTPSSGNTNSNSGTGNTGSGTGSSSGNNTSSGGDYSGGEGENAPGNGGALLDLWEPNPDVGGTTPTGPSPDWERIH